jgi:hypothetical protein
MPARATTMQAWRYREVRTHRRCRHFSLDALREAVSAHGTLVANTSAIVIGDEPHIELGLQHTQPVIVLSASQSLPGGPAPSPSPISCCARAHWPYSAPKCQWTCAATRC